jgi:hypothetical protein
VVHLLPGRQGDACRRPGQGAGQLPGSTSADLLVSPLHKRSLAAAAGTMVGAMFFRQSEMGFTCAEVFRLLILAVSGKWGVHVAPFSSGCRELGGLISYAKGCISFSTPRAPLLLKPKA